jgi:uncharacterized iron-regulated membrane protein
MAFDKRNIRLIHRRLVPIMALPLLITVLTGSLFQVAELTGHESNFYWLLDVHKGEFGPIDLEMIYPFLNGLGLLLLLSSGVVMWWTTRPRKRQGT